MLRYLALTLLVGCSASAGASVETPPDAVAGMAGAAPEPTAGAPIGGGGASAGAPSSAGAVVAKGGTPEPTAGAPTVAGASSGGGGGAAGLSSAGGSSAGAPPTAGAPSAGAGSTCPADFYCHELGPDAFAKCITEDQPDDPNFPGCQITRGACYYPTTAPESCIKAECWKNMRTCG